MKTMKALPSTQPALSLSAALKAGVADVLRACLVVLALTFATAACDGPVGPQGDRGAQGSAGEDGSQGPQGPGGQDGERGPRGPAGQDGQDGQDGEDGNANVIYSDWAPINFQTYSSGSWRRSVGVPEMTSSILSQGTVLVHARPASTPSEQSLLPYTYPVVDDGVIRPHSLLSARFVVGTMHLRSIPYQPYIAGHEFAGWNYRYIIIPGGVPGGGLRAGLQAGPDLNDYDAVKAYYGIPDDGAGVITL